MRGAAKSTFKAVSTFQAAINDQVHESEKLYELMKYESFSSLDLNESEENPSLYSKHNQTLGLKKARTDFFDTNHNSLLKDNLKGLKRKRGDAYQSHRQDEWF